MLLHTPVTEQLARPRFPDGKSSSTSVYATAHSGNDCGARAASSFVALFIIAYVIYGYQPGVGASAEASSHSTMAVARAS